MRLCLDIVKSKVRSPRRGRREWRKPRKRKISSKHILKIFVPENRDQMKIISAEKYAIQSVTQATIAGLKSLGAKSKTLI